MNQRKEWIDISKGILIVLVVAGHAHINPTIDYLINSFHMAAFFLLSGITFSVKDDFEKHIGKRFKRIIIPYFFFSAFLLVYQFLSYCFFHNGNFDIVSGLRSVFLPTSGVEGTTVYHLWFLPCIFLADIVLYWIIKAYGKHPIYSALLIGIVFSVCIGIFLTTGIASIISILPIGIFYMLCGYISRTKIASMKSKSIVCGLISLCVYLIVVICNYQFGAKSVDMSSMNFGILPLYIISGMAGAILIIAVSQTISKDYVFNRIGKNSLYYYGLHYEVLGVTNKVIGGGYFDHSRNPSTLIYCY